MKKLTFILILTTVFLINATAQEIKHEFKIGLLAPTHQEQDQQFIYGKVKEIHYVAYRGTEENGQIVNGERIKRSAASPSNILQQSWSYYFNDDGKLVKLALQDDDLQPEWIGVVHYDGDREQNVYWLRKDTLISYNTFTDLGDGQIEKKLRNINTGDAYGSSMYTYNENGHLIKRERFDQNGQPLTHIVYERDEAGHKITRKILNKEGEVLWAKDNFDYEQGLPMKWHATLNNGEKIDNHPTRTYEFDKHGNWTKMTHVGGGENRAILIVERSFVFYE